MFIKFHILKNEIFMIIKVLVAYWRGLNNGEYEERKVIDGLSTP